MLQYELKAIKNRSSLAKEPDYHFTVSIDDAKKIIKHPSVEMYDAKTIRQAVRAKNIKVTIQTSGFGVSHFSRILEEVAGGYENTKVVDNVHSEFDKWLESNYDFSGYDHKQNRCWLSRSPTDYTIYSSSELLVTWGKLTRN